MEFLKSSFIVPVGSEEISQEKWDSIFKKEEIEEENDEEETQ